MLVHATDQQGTIGGGRLEFEATNLARRLLSEASSSWRRHVESWPLGPNLGQCCGGRVTLLFEVFRAKEQAALRALLSDVGEATALRRPLASGGAPVKVSAPASCTLEVTDDAVTEPVTTPLTPLYLYGAGHVGRALAAILRPLDFAVVWVDIAESRFPPASDASAERQPALLRTITDRPDRLATHAPPDALHVVVTHDHALDLDICHAVLARDEPRFLGLIGSETKAQRFRSSLLKRGLSENRIADLVCPIGLGSSTDKHPHAIAVAVAAQLLEVVSVTARRSAESGS